MPDARGAIGEAKVAFNDGGKTRQGPECITKAMGTRALAEKVEQVVTLLGVESGLPVGMAFRVKASLPMVLEGIAPASDGTRRRFDRSRALSEAPACFEQRDSGASSDFELEFGAFRSHGDLIGRTELSL